MDKVETALTMILILVILAGFGLQGHQRRHSDVRPVLLNGALSPATDSPSGETPFQSNALEKIASQISTEDGKRVRTDINAATQRDLMKVSGIGSVLSSRIISYRDSHGPFARMEDLLNVSGIGPARLQDLQEHFTVVGEPQTRSAPAHSIASIAAPAPENLTMKSTVRQDARSLSSRRIPREAKVERVNINTVDARTLADSVPGIGLVLANRIIEERDRRGGFTKLEQVKEVYGIGEKRFEEIEKKVYLQ